VSWRKQSSKHTASPVYPRVATVSINCNAKNRTKPLNRCTLVLHINMNLHFGSEHTAETHTGSGVERSSILSACSISEAKETKETILEWRAHLAPTVDDLIWRSSCPNCWWSDMPFALPQLLMIWPGADLIQTADDLTYSINDLIHRSPCPQLLMIWPGADLIQTADDLTYSINDLIHRSHCPNCWWFRPGVHRALTDDDATWSSPCPNCDDVKWSLPCPNYWWHVRWSWQ
jgi:hypothetical protein